MPRIGRSMCFTLICCDLDGIQDGEENIVAEQQQQLQHEQYYILHQQHIGSFVCILCHSDAAFSGCWWLLWLLLLLPPFNGARAMPKTLHEFRLLLLSYQLSSRKHTVHFIYPVSGAHFCRSKYEMERKRLDAAVPQCEHRMECTHYSYISGFMRRARIFITFDGLPAYGCCQSLEYSVECPRKDCDLMIDAYNYKLKWNKFWGDFNIRKGPPKPWKHRVEEPYGIFLVYPAASRR